MTVHWMRYLVGDAGHLQRTYLAVLTKSQSQTESLRALCEIYLERYAKLTVEGTRKRGLLNSEWRSAEPHFSFARELDLLEGRQMESWNVTFGPGRAFLALWEAGTRPTELLLHQALAHDRTFLLPFLARLVDSDYDFVRGQYVGLEDDVREVWGQIWQEHRQELQGLEPPLPTPENVGRRTLLHHAAARVRFLNKVEGLGLNVDKLRRLVEQFEGFEESAQMPADAFARIKLALYGIPAAEIGVAGLGRQIPGAFAAIQRAGYMSAYGAYLYINERLGQGSFVSWDAFRNHVRTEKTLSQRASFRRDDFLVGVNKPVSVVR